MICLGNGVDLFRRVQAAALHQFDVDNVCSIDLAGLCCVDGGVDRLIQHDLQVHLGTHKAHTVQIPAGQTLFHRFHAQLFKGFQGAHRIADSVTLVGVHTQTDVGTHRLTDQGQCLDILDRVDAGLDFQNGEAILFHPFPGFGGHSFRCVNAHRHVSDDLVHAATQHLVQRLTHQFALDIVQGNIHRGLCRGVA